MYGTVAYRSEVEVEADSSEDAVVKAEELAEKGKVFNDEYFEDYKGAYAEEPECVDGWNIQAENVEELGSKDEDKNKKRDKEKTT